MPKIPEPIARAIESAHIPALPQALLRLMQLVDDDGATTLQLARVVEQDPGLCARLLTAANSPALRRGADLYSVESCLIALGTRLIRSIATCLAVKSTFERSGTSPRLDLAGFWFHSLHVAEMSRSLAVADGYAHPDQAYMAGLLHDVGILVMLSAVGDDYAGLLDWSGGEPGLGALEREHFGVDHAEVATWLIDRWQLDNSFADGILFHHVDAAAIETAGRLPQIVWLAHALVADGSAAPALAPTATRVFGTAIAGQLDALRDESRRCVLRVAEAIGAAPPESSGDAAGVNSLPRLAGRPEPLASAAAEAEIDACVGSMAALQADLQGLDNDTDLLLSMREAARILFDLSHSAFLLADPAGTTLSGAAIRGQAAVFRDNDLATREHRCLAVAAVAGGQIRSSFDGLPGEASLLDRQYARALDSEGLLCVPMVARRRTVGVMIFGLSRPQYERLSKRLSWLRNFARIAALGIEGRQDAESSRRQAAIDAADRFDRQARRVVHEAGNPLGIIKGYLKLLDQRLPAGAEVHDELAVLREEIDRVAAIVQRMSDLPPVAASAGLDLAKLLNEMLSLYRAPLFSARGIVVETELDADVGPVACDRESVVQILLNLWKNAAEAMAGGGHLAIGLATAAPHHGRLCVELRMEDSGPGIPARQAAHLAHPDQAMTSGSRGHGLSIIGTLAARAGIEIDCEGRSGIGTRLRLFLPATT